MGSFADNMARPPRTLTEREQHQLLKATGERRDGFRDHVIYAMALSTGLREHELVGLDVGDVFDDDGNARRRVTLRVFKGSRDDGRARRSCSPTACAPSSSGSGSGRRASTRAWTRRRRSS